MQKQFCLLQKIKTNETIRVKGKVTQETMPFGNIGIQGVSVKIRPPGEVELTCRILFTGV